MEATARRQQATIQELVETWKKNMLQTGSMEKNMLMMASKLAAVKLPK